MQQQQQQHANVKPTTTIHNLQFTSCSSRCRASTTHSQQTRNNQTLNSVLFHFFQPRALLYYFRSVASYDKVAINAAAACSTMTTTTTWRAAVGTPWKRCPTKQHWVGMLAAPTPTCTPLINRSGKPGRFDWGDRVLSWRQMNPLFCWLTSFYFAKNANAKAMWRLEIFPCSHQCDQKLDQKSSKNVSKSCLNNIHSSFYVNWYSLK